MGRLELVARLSELPKRPDHGVVNPVAPEVERRLDRFAVVAEERG
jgi:hypothetical protein